MKTVIVSNDQAAKLAAQARRQLSELQVGQEGFLLSSGAKLGLMNTAGGDRFVIAGYAGDGSDITEALAAVGEVWPPRRPFRQCD